MRCGCRALVSLRFAFVDGNPVAVRICDKGEIADWSFDVIRKNCRAGIFQMGNGCSQVLDFQRNAGTARARRLPGIRNGQGPVSNFVLDPVLSRHPLDLVVELSGRKPKDLLIELSGSIYVRDWVGSERDFRDLDHNGGWILPERQVECDGWLSFWQRACAGR